MSDNLDEILVPYYDTLVTPDTLLAYEAADLCPHCAAGAPHHTVGEEGIGDAARRVVYDLHEVEDTSGVGLSECLAARLFDGRLL